MSIESELEDLGRDAIPRDDVDWGSPRQIEAENRFYEAVSHRVTPSEFEHLTEMRLRRYTIEEIVEEALLIVRRHLH